MLNKNRCYLASLIIMFFSYSLVAVKFEAYDDEIDHQQNSYPSSFSFYDAFQEALNNFLYNDDNDDTLLSMAMRCFASKGQAIAALYELFSESNNILRLLSADDLSAPRGESIHSNWIFRLYIKKINRYFWAIVHRSDAKPVYNYTALQEK
jgi:hypothetical protein